MASSNKTSRTVAHSARTPGRTACGKGVLISRKYLNSCPKYGQHSLGFWLQSWAPRERFNYRFTNTNSTRVVSCYDWGTIKFPLKDRGPFTVPWCIQQRVCMQTITCGFYGPHSRFTFRLPSLLSKAVGYLKLADFCFG